MMAKWTRIEHSEEGHLYEGRMIHNQRIKIFVPSDGRLRPRVWTWHTGHKVWVENCNPHAADGIKLPVRARQAPPFVLEPAPNDPRDARVAWQAITRTKKGAPYSLNTPSNTKRPVRTKTAAARGQRGNRGTAGTAK